jgi:hypothetical protein
MESLEQHTHSIGFSLLAHSMNALAACLPGAHGSHTFGCIFTRERIHTRHLIYMIIRLAHGWGGVGRPNFPSTLNKLPRQYVDCKQGELLRWLHNM